ncbi:MAG TPA: O-antigen ligase family protein [Capillimicrobium sp.]|nr:O-antigen ligase family protein [Capillimicrobium sp.]
MTILAAAALVDALARIGVVVAAILASTALLSGSTRGRALAALAALALTPVILVADIWDSPQVQTLRDRPLVAVVLVVVAAVAVGALAVLMHRHRTLLPMLAVAALPFRIPISVGGDTANLLVPLYGVIAAGVLAYAVPRLRAEDDDAPFAPRALEWLLCATIVLYAVQAAYSDDFAKALQNVVFFYVPFALLFGLLREVRWSRELAVRCLGVLLALAVVFVCVGFVEYARKELLLNPDLIAATQYQSYFRVNSLFFDPNVYGRFLALVMLAVATVVLWSQRTREVTAGALLLALLWAGLLLSFSQSSLAALLAGLAVLAALRWSVRWTAAVVAAGAVAGIALVLLAPGATRFDLTSQRAADRATSGRADLVVGGVELFGERPLTGYGSGSFAKVFAERKDTSDLKVATASHTMPVTFAAEQGIVGLAVYVALLVAAFVRLLAGAGRSPLRAYVGAAFTALVVHTLLYAAYLEDPMTWALLGVGTALAAAAPALSSPRRRSGSSDAAASSPLHRSSPA